MLNADTRTLLKNLININNQMIISDVMTGADEFKSIIFKANIGKIDIIPEEFGIFDTANFLQAMELLDEPSITYDKESKSIVAKDGESTLSFLTSDPSSLDVVVEAERIDTTVAAPSVLVMDFDTDSLQKIKKASGVFKNFDTLWIVNEGGKTEMKLGTQNSFAKSSNSFKINIEPEVNEKEFSIALPIESILKVPQMSYKLHVKYNEARDAYRIVLQNELLEFVLSLKE